MSCKVKKHTCSKQHGRTVKQSQREAVYDRLALESPTLRDRKYKDYVYGRC